MTSKINLHYLNELTQGDLNLQKELTTMYNRNAEEILKELQALISSNDHSKWQELTHELKGASLSVGFNIVADLCSDAYHVEQLGASGKKIIIEDLTAYINEITDLTAPLAIK